MKKFVLVCALLGAVFAKDYEVIDSVNTSFRIFGKNDRLRYSNRPFFDNLMLCLKNLYQRTAYSPNLSGC